MVAIVEGVSPVHLNRTDYLCSNLPFSYRYHTFLVSGTRIDAAHYFLHRNAAITKRYVENRSKQVFRILEADTRQSYVCEWLINYKKWQRQQQKFKNRILNNSTNTTDKTDLRLTKSYQILNLNSSTRIEARNFSFPPFLVCKHSDFLTFEITRKMSMPKDPHVAISQSIYTLAT